MRVVQQVNKIIVKFIVIITIAIAYIQELIV